MIDCILRDMGFINFALSFFRLLRPRQWTKNVFIFVGVIFAGRALNVEDFGYAIIAFIVFCILSSSVYILNDIFDVERDRLHPKKKTRPLAAGEIPIWFAWIGMVVLAAISLTAIYFNFDWKFWVISLSYLLINIGYSIFLKRIVILDVILVASGYVIRAVAGVFALDRISTNEVSYWLLICTFFLALFLILAKRLGEITDLEDGGTKTRETLQKYSPGLLDQMISLVTASTVMSYSLYTIWPRTIEALGTRKMILTIPIVIYGVFRYQYLVYKKGKGASPEIILLSDVPLLISIFIYGIAVFVLLYIL